MAEVAVVFAAATVEFDSALNAEYVVDEWTVTASSVIVVAFVGLFAAVLAGC